MKFLCIGAGSIGKRHMRNLISIGVSPENITSVDPREDRRNEVIQMGIKTVFETFDEALNDKEYQAAIVCSPTNLHITQGYKISKTRYSHSYGETTCS